ncbi:DNA-directed RNA polymerase subunit alpha [Synechococcus sp. CBW1107]|nr:DNA-directed RNA polymerase subunit alpha [Synechococcus sp. CBW1107]
MLPGDDAKHSEDTEASQAVEPICKPECEPATAPYSHRGTADTSPQRRTAAATATAAKSSITSEPHAQVPQPCPQAESEKTIIQAWHVFELAWQDAGLGNQYFMEAEELVKTVSLLDKSFEDELIGCLFQLSKKPEVLSELSTIIEHASQVKPTDSIEAIRALPYVSVALSPRPNPKEWAPEPAVVAVQSQGVEEGKSTAPQAQPATALEATLGIAFVPREMRREKPDQGLAKLSIEELGLSIRSINSLKRQGIHNLIDLAGRDAENLSGLKNLGSKAVEEIRDGLLRVGLSLPFTQVAITHSMSNQGGRIVLEGVTEDDLLTIPNFGRTSLEELRQCLAERGISISVESCRDANRGLSRDSEPQLPELETLREWTSWSGSSSVVTLADVLALDIAALPEDVGAAREKLLSTVLSAEPSYRPAPSALLDDLRAVLDPRHLEILDRRRWSQHRRTLQDIATELSLSRERVRQLQVQAEKALRLNVSNSQRLRWLLHSLRYEIGSLTTDESLTDVFDRYGIAADSLYWRMLLNLAGPYTLYENGFAGLTGADLQDKLAADAQGMLESNGHMDHQTLTELLGSAGLKGDAVVTRFLEKVAGLKRFDQQWYCWKGSSIDKAFVVLMAHGKPLTAEEITIRIGEGHTARTLCNGMTKDNRFIRTSIKQWGLREWGLEEYSGIVDEIYERIDANGGTADIEWLVDDIVKTFDVSENSVRMYLGTLAFAVENGLVRRRVDSDEWPVDSSLRAARGTYRVGASVRYEIRVSKDVLRGSGQAIPTGTAMALGVSPGAKRTFTSQTGDEVMVGWRPWSTTGPDIGSLRLPANEVGASEGNYLVLVFDTRDQTVEALLVTAESDPATVLKLLGDVNSNCDANAVLADAIEVGRGEVRSALRARGDERIADMLPKQHTGEERLRAAIGDLIDELK